MRPASRFPRARAGLTLVELLVGVTLSSILMTIAMQGWRWSQGSTLALRDRSQVVSELRVAFESLLQDLGGAETALPSGDNLTITREQAVAEVQGAWSAGTDDGIVYSLDGENLVREDLELGSIVVVAKGIDEFAVSRAGGMTHIVITAGNEWSGTPAVNVETMATRSVELVWPE